MIAAALILAMIALVIVSHPRLHDARCPKCPHCTRLAADWKSYRAIQNHQNLHHLMRWGQEPIMGCAACDRGETLDLPRKPE